MTIRNEQEEGDRSILEKKEGGRGREREKEIRRVRERERERDQESDGERCSEKDR